MLEDVQQLGADAAKLAASPLWSLGDDELTASLRAAHQLEQALVVLQARLVQQATSRDLPGKQGHRAVAGWLRDLLILDDRPAKAIARRAEALQRHPHLEQALLDGHLDARQADEIVATVEAIPAGLAECDDIGPAETTSIMQSAEDTMLNMAGRLTAYQLRSVGERILAHVAPAVADRVDEAALARQEARAHQKRGFTLSVPFQGVVRVSGQLGVEDAAVVRAALQPLCAPTPDDTRTSAQRRADALTEVCGLALRTGELPDSGGEPAQVAVTVGFDPLVRALGIGITDGGALLSAEAVRRLACDAKVLPVVLGSAGQVLDVGRSCRLATTPLRRALAVRDGGCAFPDCDRPPRWTDAHHIRGWLDGGVTSLSNLVLLCRRHHRLIHHASAGWEVRLGADGHPDFIPPPHVDPHRRPRRNLYHLRR